MLVDAKADWEGYVAVIGADIDKGLLETDMSVVVFVSG